MKWMLLFFALCLSEGKDPEYLIYLPTRGMCEQVKNTIERFNDIQTLSYYINLVLECRPVTEMDSTRGYGNNCNYSMN